MKLSGNYKSWEVTQSILGKLLNVTQQRISQLVAEGFLTEVKSSKLLNLAESIQKFIAYKLNTEYVDYKKEKALNEKAKRELNQLKLMMQRGEIYDAAEIEKEVIDAVINFRTQFQGLGNKLALQLTNKPPEEIASIINSEVEENLIELSERLKRYADTQNSGSSTAGTEVKNQ